MLLFQQSGKKEPTSSHKSAKKLSIIHFSTNHKHLSVISDLVSQTANHPLQQHRAIALHNAENIKEATNISKTQRIDLLLISLDEGQPLLDRLYTIRAATNNLPIVVIANTDQSSAISDALRAGVQDVLIAGDFSASELVRALQYAYERSHSVAKIERLKETARKNNVIKNELIYQIAQEVRKTVDRVIAITDDKHDVSSGENGSIQSLREQTLELSTVISATLDYTQINSAECKANPVKFNSEHYLRHLLNILSERANARGHVALVHLDSKCPIFMIADADKLWRITVTAFETLLKLAKPGRPIVLSAHFVRIYNQPALHLSLRLCQGEIAQKDLTALFESLNQKDLAIVKKHGPLGLCLGVAAALAEIISGKLWFEFKPGKGLIFHLETTLKTE